MTDAVTVAEYRAELRKQKQMPREKAKLYEWLADFAKRNFLSAVTEYQFHPRRKWRFDWAFLDPIKVAIEFDGLYGGGAHTSVNMVAKDSEKMNQAAILGWVVIRVNSASLRDGSGYRDIEQAIQQRIEQAVATKEDE